MREKNGDRSKVPLGHVRTRLAEIISPDEVSKRWEEFLKHCDHYMMYHTGLSRKSFPRNPLTLLSKEEIEVVRNVINARHMHTFEEDVFHRFVTK